MLLESLILFSIGAEAPADAARAEGVIRDARVMRVEHGAEFLSAERAAAPDREHDGKPAGRLDRPAQGSGGAERRG